MTAAIRSYGYDRRWATLMQVASILLLHQANLQFIQKQASLRGEDSVATAGSTVGIEITAVTDGSSRAAATLPAPAKGES